MQFPVDLKLSESQAAFVSNILAGKDTQAAAAAAGYHGGQSAGYRLLAVPAVQVAIEVGLRRYLHGELAPLAFKFMRQVLTDSADKFSEATKREVARIVVDRAGFVPAKPRELAAAADKDPEQMSMEELKAMVARLDDEIASRARPIEQVSEPSNEELADLL